MTDRPTGTPPGDRAVRTYGEPGLHPRIEARGLTKRFGGATAVDDVYLTVGPGEVVGLIGPNGAGKTTLFNLLSGALKPDSGELNVNGVRATRLPPHRLAKLGLTRTFQLARELDRLTTLENVLLAAPNHPGETLRGAFFEPRATRRAEVEATVKAREILEIVGLSAKEATLAGHLSGGQKKLLELARCLMVDADTILLDEIAAGVAPHLVEEIAALVERLNREHGTTFVIIEHNVGIIRRLSSRVVVMARGAVLAEGSFADVASNPDVVSSYLGQAA
ncbi:ABC transporter ATP-binding protein [Acuticoccus sediminis]|uniref:ABC transporter ATP-binding protein n=1 Tax=Acuticoccus sediminis TaxID=2184697 RepID=A0A8B2NWS0_9HYPH|nr:ABC transporter ATP-binding protein [Acuticoccus sediminis]RAI02253.1 ABC transporter ATP-binding protein [Acuticoccus sediminis]